MPRRLNTIMGTNDSDLKLIADILSGDTGAFASLMDRYAPRVYALVATLAGDEHEAADITQEIFIKVFGSLASFRKESSFSTWLFRISYNTASVYLRKRRRPIVIDNTGILATLEESVADEEETGVPTVEMLYAAIETLEAYERTLISLFYFDNKSVAEIAYIMSMTESNVKTRLHRIRKKLRKILTNG